LSETTATLHGISTGGQEAAMLNLGPTIYTEVEFEGIPVQAMLDTGSPVTIVSLKFALAALAKLHLGWVR